MLDFYARHFDSTESNYPFRRIPSPRTIANWFEKTPRDFSFSLRAPQHITHFAKLRGGAELIDAFWKVIKELRPKLGVALFHLAPTLLRDDQLLERFLRGVPSGPRAAFEFRHASWFTERRLRRCGMSDAASA